MRTIAPSLIALPLLLLLPRWAAADVVTDWNLRAVNTIRTAGTGPNGATRALAITHIAVHDALVAISKRYQPYGTALVPQGPASRDAAVDKAAHKVLVNLYPAQKTTLDDALQTALAGIADGPEKVNGIALGDSSADLILNARANDGAAVVEAPFLGSTEVGKWRPTPRANADAGAPLPGADPQWRNLVPFVLSSPQQFRVAVPPALTSAQYSTDFAEVQSLGLKTSATRTSEQSNIASFWAQATHVPINEIARVVSAQKGLTVDQNGYLFAILNIALADSRVGAWDSKYYFNAWRPITAINASNPDDAGAADGGGEGGTTDGAAAADDASADGAVDSAAADGAADATAVDGSASEGGAAVANASWVPFLETPNHPEYPSGHSTTGAAGIKVLATYFGDSVTFDVHSDTLSGARSFTSLAAVALENGRSRIYGGIHFQYANAAGQDLGAKIAQYALDHLLASIPVPDGGAEDADATTRSDASDASADSRPADASSVVEASVDASKAPAEAGVDGGASEADALVADGSAEGGSSKDGGADASPPYDPTNALVDDDSDCSCKIANHAKTPSSAVFAMGLLGAVALVGRRRSPRRRG